MDSTSNFVAAWQFDWAPVLSLLVVGALVALLPLWWVLRQGGDAQQRLRALGWLVLALTFDLVLVGAFTRLTDSGLGCPDWPGCYGHSSPVGAAQAIADAHAAMPHGPVSPAKAWIEMTHRYLAMAVGALLLVQAGLALHSWWQGRTRRFGPQGERQFPWLPVLLVLWVLVQGLFGALTVTMKLFPAIVTLHLLGAYGLLLMQTTWLGRWQPAAQMAAYMETQLSGWSHSALSERFTQKVDGQTLAVRAFSWLAVVWVLVQAASGAWVSTNYAVLACTTFPHCEGLQWSGPHWAQAVQWWRPLGLLADGGVLPFAALQAIHMTHRVLALVTVLLLLLVLWCWWRLAGWARPVRWLAAVLLLQVLTGISNVVLQWPLLGAMAHTGGAGALLVLLAWGAQVLNKGNAE
ncbi:COX15/CtaA family protein [Curvibacter sp. CHRR-16]|uniref:COX15/CtaA family protein n=1 Tax=Curvibacter sp. CHRR-16 TaxID=2835872 RepID=UPI001BD946E4|nr:COX15/CtaA family protein [Curvibacter sp. CHRR-16]MBT0571773.1 COX15/CtaA family protein [Curvibacter sp. CHRR-16]